MIPEENNMGPYKLHNISKLLTDLQDLNANKGLKTVC